MRIVDQQVPAKEVVPGEFVDDANGKTIGRVGACITIEDEELFTRKRAQEVAPQGLELRLIHGAIDQAPGDVGFTRGFADDELVVR